MNSFVHRNKCRYEQHHTESIDDTWCKDNYVRFHCANSYEYVRISRFRIFPFEQMSKGWCQVPGDHGTIFYKSIFHLNFWMNLGVWTQLERLLCSFLLTTVSVASVYILSYSVHRTLSSSLGVGIWIPGVNRHKISNTFPIFTWQ